MFKSVNLCLLIYFILGSMSYNIVLTTLYFLYIDQVCLKLEWYLCLYLLKTGITYIFYHIWDKLALLINYLYFLLYRKTVHVILDNVIACWYISSNKDVIVSILGTDHLLLQGKTTNSTLCNYLNWVKFKLRGSTSLCRCTFTPVLILLGASHIHSLNFGNYDEAHKSFLSE